MATTGLGLIDPKKWLKETFEPDQDAMIYSLKQVIELTVRIDGFLQSAKEVLQETGRLKENLSILLIDLAKETTTQRDWALETHNIIRFQFWSLLWVYVTGYLNGNRLFENLT